MRVLETKCDNTEVVIDEKEKKTSSISSVPSSERRSSLQCHTLRQENMPSSKDKPSAPSEYIYTEIVKAIGNNEFIEEKRLLKRASWGPTAQQEHGLPPTGRRSDNEQTTTTTTTTTSNRNATRVRMRPKVTRYFQPQQQQQPRYQQFLFGRPLSLNERYDRPLLDTPQKKLPNSSLNHQNNDNFSNKRHESSSSISPLSVDTITQIAPRALSPMDSNDFASDTSAASSVTTTTTTNTLTSISSIIPSRTSRRTSFNNIERIQSPTKRPLLSEYQQKHSTRIDYKSLPPANTVSSSSPISPSASITSFTYPKGHEQSLSSTKGSSLNQYPEFTSQTLTADTSRNNIGPTATITTCRIMTMSMSPNRYHNQTRSAKAIITSSQISPTTNVTITTNNGDGLKPPEHQDQKESTMVCSNGCLKSPTNTNTNNNNRIKKSVHFDWHLPKEILRSRSPIPVDTDCISNYEQTVTIASSSALSHGNGNSVDNDEQKKRYDDQRDVGALREKERIETTSRTITTNPLTTTTTNVRSFSLSPSPLSKRESSDSRPCREEEKENVDEPYCTTSQRVTTAAHLHCTITAATVTFNDGSNNVSQKKESNGTNNFNANLLNRQTSSFDKPMPLNSLLVKTSSLNTIINPQQSPLPSSSSSSSSSPSAAATTTTTTTTKAKKLLSNGFLNFIGRSNSSNNKSSKSTEENKQLRRASSTQLRAQRKAKQQTTLTTRTNGNKRLSTDVESLLPVSSINSNHCEISKEDIHKFDKVTANNNNERQSLISLVSTSIDKNINGTSSSSIDSSIPPCTNTSINNTSLSMSTKSTTTTIIKPDEGDSLNNGLLFRPVTDPKCDYVLHDHQKTSKEPFFLSPSKSSGNGDESTVIQTSTLIISTPPQYHYYLYPPVNNTNILSSSSSSSSSPSSTSSSSSLSSSKTNPKIMLTTNRTISNVSINSVSTNSSSSYRSFESQSQTHDNEYQQSSQNPPNCDDDTVSHLTYSVANNNNKTRQKRVIQSALIDWKMKSSSEINHDSAIVATATTKPVILSDSVQAFWPPPPSPSILDKDSELTITNSSSTITERPKQSESIPIPNNMISSSSHNDSINVNHIDILSTNEEIGSYSEQHTFTNGCLRNASHTSLEDTQASYTERLREKSRSIPMNGNNDMFSYLTRSISKDALHNCHLRPNTNLTITEFPLTNETIVRPKSASQQTRTSSSSTSQQQQKQRENSENDFQSKREFFENRIYTDNISTNSSLTSIPANILPTKPKIYTLSPSSSQINNTSFLQHATINNNAQRNITRRSWNDLSFRQLPPTPSPPSSEQYFDAVSNPTSFPPPPTIRKPVRLVKTAQQCPSPINELFSTNRPLATPKTYSLAKPGLFSASPVNSYQKLPNKSSNSFRRFQPRDENDLQFNLKEFALRYSHNNSLSELQRLMLSNKQHLSTDFTRGLFPIPDRLRRIRSRQSSGGDTSSITTSSNSSSDYIHRTVSNDSCIFDDDTCRQVDDLLTNLKKRRQILKENQRTINEEIEDNKNLGIKLLNIIESNAESSEIEKFKLHIDEIDTITSILLKLSTRLARVENDLLMISSSNEHTKASLIERREKAQQKHDEAKSLKDGIDRRSRTVTNILRKYFSNEQYDDYEHFIRMKSTLSLDAKDLEENISTTEKQIEILNHISLSDLSTSNNAESSLQTNSFHAISSTT
ncbi:unnamed protein product [Rotaria socialis]